MGTAKIVLLAYDTRTRQAVINTGYSLARADHKFWQVLGVGGQESGSVQRELVASTNETPSAAETAAMLAQKPGTLSR